MAPGVSDEALMWELQAGRSAALEHLIERYGPALWGFVRQMCGPARGEEVYQEVWTRLYVFRRHYQPFRPFRPYLFRIAANCCRSSLARPRMASLDALCESAAVEPIGREDPPLDRLVAEEQRDRLRRAIGRLPWMQRVVVTMYCLVTTDYAEIAGALGKARATVRRHMQEALNHLRADLAAVTEGEVDREQVRR